MQEIVGGVARRQGDDAPATGENPQLWHGQSSTCRYTSWIIVGSVGVSLSHGRRFWKWTWKSPALVGVREKTRVPPPPSRFGSLLSGRNSFVTVILESAVSCQM